VSQSTVVPDYARYQIVQSPILAKLTIRLDRFTGQTWQFSSTAEGGYAWGLMKRNEASTSDIKVPGKVNYQIFMSGILAQVSILINTNTGASWCIAQDPKLGEFWSPMD